MGLKTSVFLEAILQEMFSEIGIVSHVKNLGKNQMLPRGRYIIKERDRQCRVC